LLMSRRRGPGVKNAAPGGVAEDERFLMPGWRLLQPPLRTPVVGGDRASGLSGRASRSWIGPPPLSCSRVEIAGCGCAGVRPSLSPPPERTGGRERPGIWSATAVGWRVWEDPRVPGADRRDTRRLGVTSGCHLRPHKPGQFASDRGGHCSETVFARGRRDPVRRRGDHRRLGMLPDRSSSLLGFARRAPPLETAVAEAGAEATGMMIGASRLGEDQSRAVGCHALGSFFLPK